MWEKGGEEAPGEERGKGEGVELFPPTGSLWKKEEGSSKGMEEGVYGIGGGAGGWVGVGQTHCSDSGSSGVDVWIGCVVCGV